MESKPEFAVTVHQDQMVEMHDGVHLAVDVYRPAAVSTGEAINDTFPALLVRTPYNKRSQDTVEQAGRWYAQRGYVVALQDVRGRYASEGEFYLLKNEAKDGRDTVEWLSNQPYCDGQVGTMGTSYKAWVQSALATLDPDGLAAMFINQGGANAWEATLRHNGTFELRWLTWALTYGGGFSHRSLENEKIQQMFANVDTRDLLAEEPLIKGQSPLTHLPDYEEYLFDFLTLSGKSDHWDDRSLNFSAHYDEMADVPTVYSGSWYDSYAKATKDNFEKLKEKQKSDHFLIMGPWTHGGQDTWTRTYSGEVDFGEDAVVNHLETKLQFFDHYLKNKDTWADQPHVQYFRMGTGDGAQATNSRLNYGGSWKEATDWPIPGTEFTKYYARKNGTLSTDPPRDNEGKITYEFDPHNPVPTIGGNCSSYYTFEPRDEPIEQYPLKNRHKISITGRGGYDQRTTKNTFGAEPPYGPLEHRSDVVTFRTSPLKESVEIAGPIRVSIFASSDSPDTDFTAKLIDEHPPSDDFPGGYALNITDSICRARYRGYRREPELLNEGEVYEFYLEPYPTATVFKQNHCIRLDISSSNYPRFDVNHNTGGPLYGDREYNIANNTIYYNQEYPTHIELPVQTNK